MSLSLFSLFALATSANALPWDGPSYCDLNPNACYIESAPDLTITDITMECVGLTSKARITVANQGLESATTYVDVWFGEYAAPQMGDWGEFYETVTVRGGASVVVELDIGHYGESGWLDVIVDTDDAVAETIESNNASYSWVTVPEYCLG